MRNVLIALPAYNGTVRVETSACINEATVELLAMGWKYKLRYAVGDSILPRCRNKFIAEAVAGDYTDLVFLDHDIAWGEGALVRLLEHPVDFVAGVYPKREDPISFPARFLENQEIARNPITGLIPVDGVPAGFLRVTTRALRAMVQHYWHLKYDEKGVPNDTAWSLFDFQLIEGRYWGEDFVFCRRWTAMGGGVYVDPDIKFAHIGSKAYIGSLTDWLDQTAHERQPAESAPNVQPIKPIVRVPAASAVA
jgi:hypothetical protein